MNSNVRMTWQLKFQSRCSEDFSTCWSRSKQLLLPSASGWDLCYVKVTQSCPALWDPVDYIVHGILQVRILEWVAFPFSRGSPQPRDRTQVSCISGRFFTNWAIREALKWYKREYIWPLSLDPCTEPGISWTLVRSMLMNGLWLVLLSFRMWECGLVTIMGQPHI